MAHTLRTERLLLRPVTLRDAPAFWRIANDAAQTRMTSSWRAPFTVEEVRRRFRDAAETDDLFAIVADGALAGTIGSYGDEVGYWIGRGFEGQGIATEALRLFCDFAFRIRRRVKLEAIVFADNPASIKILERCGFQLVGPHLGYSLQRGVSAPGWRYSLSRERMVT